MMDFHNLSNYLCSSPGSPGSSFPFVTTDCIRAMSSSSKPAEINVHIFIFILLNKWNNLFHCEGNKQQPRHPRRETGQKVYVHRICFILVANFVCHGSRSKFQTETL